MHCAQVMKYNLNMLHTPEHAEELHRRWIKYFACVCTATAARKATLMQLLCTPQQPDGKRSNKPRKALASRVRCECGMRRLWRDLRPRPRHCAQLLRASCHRMPKTRWTRSLLASAPRRMSSELVIGIHDNKILKFCFFIKNSYATWRVTPCTGRFCCPSGSGARQACKSA